MKTLLLTFCVLLAGSPALAAESSIQKRAKTLEAEMDKVRPDLVTTDSKSVAAQAAIVEKATVFVRGALESTTPAKISKADMEAIARILVRNADYDNSNDLGGMNAELIEKYTPRIQQAFADLVKKKIFTAQQVELAAINLDIGTRNTLEGEDLEEAPKARPQPAVKPKAKKQGGLRAKIGGNSAKQTVRRRLTAPAGSRRIKGEDGAALPCLEGNCEAAAKSAAMLAPTAVRNLEDVQSATFSCEDAAKPGKN